MKRILSILIVCLLIILAGCKENIETEETKREMTNHSVYKEGIDYEDSLWSKPQFYKDPSKDRTDLGIEALWIRSDYLSLESYAFAYLGIPNNPSGKAVVLIHGGGGTAYYEWVQMWMSHGFIALAIDLEGHVPKETGNLHSYPQDLYIKSDYTTPHNQNYNDSHLPIEETWMHYATRTAIIANSFLHNLDIVDPYAVGIAGISWGGIITSIVTGYDDRFAFSIPIYSTLNQAETDSAIATYYQNNPNALVWDDDEALSKVHTPVHLIVSNVDQFGKLESTTMTLSRLKKGSVTIIKDLLHSSAIAAECIEQYTFAEKMVSKTDIVRFEVSPSFLESEVSISIPNDTTIEQAIIVYSTEENNISASWSKRNINLNGDRLTYNIPEGTTMFFLSVIDHFGNTWSTPLIENH